MEGMPRLEASIMPQCKHIQYPIKNKLVQRRFLEARKMIAFMISYKCKQKFPGQGLRETSQDKLSYEIKQPVYTRPQNNKLIMCMLLH